MKKEGQITVDPQETSLLRELIKAGYIAVMKIKDSDRCEILRQIKRQKMEDKTFGVCFHFCDGYFHQRDVESIQVYSDPREAHSALVNRMAA